MQLVLRQRSRKVGVFDFNYTWSHAVDNASASESNGGNHLMDAFNPKAFRAARPIPDIRPHNIPRRTACLPAVPSTGTSSSVRKAQQVGGWCHRWLADHGSREPPHRHPPNLSATAVSWVVNLSKPHPSCPSGQVSRCASTASTVPITRMDSPACLQTRADAKSLHGRLQHAGTVGTRGTVRGPNLSATHRPRSASSFKMPSEGSLHLQVRGEAFNDAQLCEFPDPAVEFRPLQPSDSIVPRRTLA